VLEIRFSRRTATATPTSELLNRLASKLGVRSLPSPFQGNGPFLLGDTGISISFTLGQDNKPISATAEVSDEAETSRLLAILRVFESLGWSYSKRGSTSSATKTSGEAMKSVALRPDFPSGRHV